MTKKLTRIESQRSFRSDVMRARKVSPATANSSSSPIFQPSVRRMPSSTEISCASGANQRPALTVLWAGGASMNERLNSRSTSRRARSSS
jgi:hypothetical protein